MARRWSFRLPPPGEVTLKFNAIQDIKTEAELHVTVEGGKTVIGPVTTTDGKVQIATKTCGTVEAPKEEGTLIRNDAEHQAYEKSLHPGLLQGWNGGIDVGFSVARGNRQSENLALAFMSYIQHSITRSRSMPLH